MTTPDDLNDDLFYPVDIGSKKIYLLPEDCEAAVIKKWECKYPLILALGGRILKQNRDLYLGFIFVQLH
jgi:hypothetical protein